MRERAREKEIGENASETDDTSREKQGCKAERIWKDCLSLDCSKERGKSGRMRRGCERENERES